MAVADEIRSYLAQEGAKVGGKGASGDATLVLAEQKSFLSKKRAEYLAKFRVDDGEHVIRFFEMLRETGSGMSGGASDDVGGGWGFSKETYKTGAVREGDITEQGALLGKRYSFKFDYARIRERIGEIAAEHGYRLECQLTPKGL